MKRLELDPQVGFDVVAGTSRSQAATMVIEPNGSTGGPDNRHEGSDQWLYVISGRARARVEGEEVALAPGVLLLIEAGERHEIVNDDDEALRTLNIYAPPEY